MDRSRAASSALALLAIACGPPPLAPDASIDSGRDAPTTRLTLAIEGPDFAFVRTSACYRAVHEGGPGAVVSIVWADGTTEELAPGVSEACHSYAFPGPVVMGMSVDARGMRAEATRLVHVE